MKLFVLLRIPVKKHDVARLCDSVEIVDVDVRVMPEQAIYYVPRCTGINRNCSAAKESRAR